MSRRSPSPDQLGGRFNGRVVLVTGASSGIGRAAALEFASRGAKVALVALDRVRLEGVAREVKELGGEALALVADVADRGQVEGAMLSIRNRWGRLDVLVNNAGYLVYGSVEECRVEDFERQISVNYLGAVYFTKAALGLMRAQGAGAIVNVASISGSVYMPFNSAYQASKAALRAFTLTLRRELAGAGITVSLISPGRTQTEITRQAILRGMARGRPMLREMPAERVARAIVDCVERPRREVLMPLVLRPLVVAYALVPDAVERWLPLLQHRWARWSGGPQV